jgi:hypothetical protein
MIVLSRFARVLVTALVVPVLAGCGSSDDRAETSGAAGSAGSSSGGGWASGGSAGSSAGSGWASGGSSATAGAGASGGNGASAGSSGGAAGEGSGGAGAGGSGGDVASCFDVTQTSADWIWPEQEPELSTDVGSSLPEMSPLALTQTLRQPFAQTSYICQSYRGFSHKSGYPLDIGVTPQSCNGGNNDSGGKDVVAPASGKVTHMPGTGLAEYLCIQLDGGGAVALGHVKAAAGISNGSVVKKGQKVATISHAWDKTSSNAGIAHLHLEAFDGTGCYNGNPKPFTAAFRMDCAPDLPFNGTYGHYNGTKLTPCPSTPAKRGEVAMLYSNGETSASIYAWTSNGSALALQSNKWSSSQYALSRVGDRVAAGDFDGDGKHDIAAAMKLCDGSLRIHTWSSTGTGFSYGGPAGFANDALDPEAAAGRLVAGDFAGDKKDELALLYAPSSGGVAIKLYPGGTTAWSVASGYSLAQVGDRFVAGDFNGDGKDDVATAYQYADGTFRFHVWLASSGKLAYTGAGGWYQSGQFSLGPVAGRMAAGDFNGDGKDDIALMRNHGSSGAKLWVWTSTGSAFVLQTSSWSVDSGYGLSNVGNRFVAADLDADGRADAITAYQYSDGTFRYHVWKGTGTTMTYGGSSGWYQSGNFPLGNVQGRLVAGNWNGI